MKIPRKLQIFAAPVILSDKDAQRLAPYLSGWITLHRLMAGVCERDLERLVILELLHRRRRTILVRLRMRLVTIYRNELQRRIDRHA